MNFVTLPVLYAFGLLWIAFLCALVAYDGFTIAARASAWVVFPPRRLRWRLQGWIFAALMFACIIGAALVVTR